MSKKISLQKLADAFYLKTAQDKGDVSLLTVTLRPVFRKVGKKIQADLYQKFIDSVQSEPFPEQGYLYAKSVSVVVQDGKLISAKINTEGNLLKDKVLGPVFAQIIREGNKQMLKAGQSEVERVMPPETVQHTEINVNQDRSNFLDIEVNYE